MRRIFSRRSTSKTNGSADINSGADADEIDDLSDENSEVVENACLSPKDAFLKFDTDGSGDIDEDEFFHLLQSVGVKGNEEYQEKLFRRYVKSGSKTIDYDGFKSAWLLLGNPKQELIERGVKDIPKIATRYQLVRLLEKTLDDEERLDALAKAEANRYRTLRDRKKVRSDYVQKARARAGVELGAALDAAGSCYVLGVGAQGQFSGTPKADMSSSSFQQVGFDRMQQLWGERVEAMGANSNTAGVWGRQPRKIAITNSAILALTDNGLLSWGGSSNWHNISSRSTLTTPRSSALLMNDERMHRKHMAMIQEEASENDAKSAFEVERLESVLRYYRSWPPHFDGTIDVQMVQEHLEVNVTHDQFFHSLLLRGKPCDGSGLSKLDMAEILATDINLEREILGERGQQELCDIEWEIIHLKKRRQVLASKSARLLERTFSEKWVPLSAEQKQRAIKTEERKVAEKRKMYRKKDKEYEKWNEHRADMQGVSICEGELIRLSFGSITARGTDIQTPRGVSQILDVSAGSNHAAIIVQDAQSCGRLYTWGMSSLGRLGQGNGEHSCEDTNYPKMVEEFQKQSIIQASCGQSHSASISSDGSLYVWGAGSSRLGFGEMPESEGYFCAIPTKLHIPSCKVVTKVACGSSHTACIGSGKMYIWGSGDGGRLGLGQDRMHTHHTPTLVDSLCHEIIVDVSCGTSTTLALTIIENKGSNGRKNVKRVTGGRLYVAGPKNIVGSLLSSFRELGTLKQNPVVIKSIAAGYSHQSFVTVSGELYCWGQNFHGCCGQEKGIKFIAEPTKVNWLYKAPENLALGKKSCTLSTLFKDKEGLSALNAVDGNLDGTKEALAHTFHEANPYFQIDLGSFAHITRVRLWNRTDEPNDCSLSSDTFSKRLFPCYIMISQFPFPHKLEGKEGLVASLKQSVAKVRFAEDRRLSNWTLPTYTVGRYLRVQLEGTNFLHFAQLEVFGHVTRSHGPIATCSAGRFVTAAVIGRSGDKEVAAAYKRAISADWYNAEILRQFISYKDEYRKEDNSFACTQAKCLLCVGSEKCEICSLRTKFRSELKDVVEQEEPFRLDDIASHLLSATNVESVNSVEMCEGGTCKKDGGRVRNIIPILTKMRLKKQHIEAEKLVNNS